MLRAANAKLVVLAAATIGLAGCTYSELRIDPDYGKALSQDVAAQIADPDAHYLGVPAPGSNGARVSLAQRRYQTNTVVPPSSVGASSAASINGFDNGANPLGPNSGPGVGMATTTTGP